MGAELLSILVRHAVRIGKQSHRPIDIEVRPEALDSVQVDTTRLVELVGPAKVSWKEGFRRMVKARAPELLRKGA